MPGTLHRSPRKAKGAGAERREEILAAALRLFGEYGLYGVSTRQIAQAVGVSQPTLYAYFTSKDEIAAELHARAFRELEARLKLGVRDVDTLEAVAASLRIYIDFGLENPDAYRVAFMIEGPHGRVAVEGPADESDVSVPGHTAFDILRRMIADLHRRGLGAGDDPERMAQSIWAGMHGLVSLLIARPGFPWVEREALVAGHVRMLAAMAMRRDG
ncbi:TetR/AcrR family transcriptional regulator [Phenylobacterium sp.]|jgi:AcrR family transcriptional regulator|uniref:TetR/AcrR family transcriptional regulator n=1 Tax=Phenylobacterium sp. TaxID=1871053 RepID=UPI0037CB1783